MNEVGWSGGNRLLVVGCGYLGRRVARRFRDAGKTVYAMTRSAEHAAEFEAMGITPVLADITEPETLSNLPAADAVLIAVGYDRGSGKSITEIYVQGLENLLAKLPDSVRRLVYVSSTGVYAQSDGSWVDESSPCEPVREGGRACLEAENRIAASAFADRSVVLRLAGIYGPGRLPLRGAIERGEPLDVSGDGYLNLIYVTDAATVVLAAIDFPFAPRTWLVADGQPVLRRDYYAEVARLLNAPPPKFCSDGTREHARSRAEADKRISSRRLLEELRVTFAFADYRQGLAAIVSGDDA
ncbi:MAG: hypothetical protein RIS70_841 [Planctomycetota bacterium]